MQRQETEARTLEMHPDDAARKNLADGEIVRVFNDRGDFTIPLRLSSKVQPGTVATYWGYWDKRSNGRGTVNNVTSPALTDVGGGATFYDCQVDVERWRVPS
jgi:anaerobic selenocysteine-containing dehydrogenase